MDIEGSLRELGLVEADPLKETAAKNSLGFQ